MELHLSLSNFLLSVSWLVVFFFPLPPVFIYPSFSDSYAPEHPLFFFLLFAKSNVWLRPPHGCRCSSSPAGHSTSWAASHRRTPLYPQWWYPALFPPCQVGLWGDPKLSMTHHHFLPLAVSSHQPLSVSLFFFLHNGANAQPCGQLTGRLGPYANFMMAETIVCSANCRNDVVFGAALILTLICGELLMINRVRDCF